MKRFRIFSPVLSFVMISYVSIMCLPTISVAADTPRQKCINSCGNDKAVCLNMNPDKRLCQVEFQKCFDACKSKSDAPVVVTPANPEPQNIQPSNETGPK